MPELVVPTAYTDACSETWADPVALATAYSSTLELATEAAVSATYILNQLTYNRFHGYQCWVDDYRIRSVNIDSRLGYNRFNTNIGLCNTIKFDILHFPVVEVVAVTSVSVCNNSVGATGFGDAISSWCYLGRQRVKLSDLSCSCSDKVIRVHYKAGPNLPPGADRAAYLLATEYLKASNSSQCMLPDRVTAVTRQGVSWTVLDPQLFLKNGLTGIGAVDQWLNATNGKGVAGIIDPLYTPALIASTLVGCGIDCEIAVS